MDVLHSLNAFEPPPGGTVISIGNFDGVHRGHQALLRAAREQAAAWGAPVVVVTFEPHPLTVLAPHRAPARLASAAEKLDLLRSYGADAVIALTSHAALFALDADAFLATIRRACRPRAIIEGESFNFGRDRGGNVETLRDAGARDGFVVQIVPTANCEALADRPAVSSSAIRGALAAGEVRRAAHLLGRAYRLAGSVGAGAGRGAGLGVATANLEAIEQMTPADGVYAVVAELADGQRRSAAVNVGLQPTFGGTQRTIEAHLLDYAGDLRGQRLALHFIDRLRGQVRFETPAALVAQIQTDIQQVRALTAEEAIPFSLVRLAV